MEKETAQVKHAEATDDAQVPQDLDLLQRVKQIIEMLESNNKVPNAVETQKNFAVLAQFEELAERQKSQELKEESSDALLDQIEIRKETVEVDPLTAPKFRLPYFVDTQNESSSQEEEDEELQTVPL